MEDSQHIQFEALTQQLLFTDESATDPRHTFSVQPCQDSVTVETLKGQQLLPFERRFLVAEEIDEDDLEAQYMHRVSNLIGSVDILKNTVLTLENSVERAQHDSMTGLMNRDTFERILDAHVAEQDRIILSTKNESVATRRGDTEKLGLALLFIDLDRFKQVNDTYGHAAGDQILLDAATVIERSIRPSDSAARLGGDEFVIALNQGIDFEQVEMVRSRIIEGIESLTIKDTAGVVGASIGITMHVPGMSAVEMLDLADSEMYHDKQQRRDAERLREAEVRRARAVVEAAGLSGFEPTSDDPMGEALVFIHGNRP